MSTPRQAGLFGGEGRPRRYDRPDETPAGYAALPGTGPQGETCGSCRHHTVLFYSKRYHKCRLKRAQWNSGPTSDIRVRSPACAKWEANT